jgi:hypothetical protein
VGQTGQFTHIVRDVLLEVWSMKSRRAVITKPGGPEVLAIVEQELAEPQPNEVQLRVLPLESLLVT